MVEGQGMGWGQQMGAGADANVGMGVGTGIGRWQQECRCRCQSGLGMAGGVMGWWWGVVHALMRFGMNDGCRCRNGHGSGSRKMTTRMSWLLSIGVGYSGGWDGGGSGVGSGACFDVVWHKWQWWWHCQCHGQLCLIPDRGWGAWFGERAPVGVSCMYIQVVLPRCHTMKWFHSRMWWTTYISVTKTLIILNPPKNTIPQIVYNHGQKSRNNKWSMDS